MEYLISNEFYKLFSLGSQPPYTRCNIIVPESSSVYILVGEMIRICVRSGRYSYDHTLINLGKVHCILTTSDLYPVTVDE